MGRLLAFFGPKRGHPSWIAIIFSPSGPFPAAASPSGRVKGRLQPGEASPLMRPAGMRQSASSFSFSPS